MNKEKKYLLWEEKILQPALLIYLYIALIFSAGYMLYKVASGPSPLLYILFSLPFAVSGYYTTMFFSKSISKLKARTIEFLILFTVWILLSFRIFDVQISKLISSSFSLLITKHYHIPISGLVAFFSWRVMINYARDLEIPNLIPIMKIDLGHDFDKWAASFLQGKSVSKLTRIVKQRAFSLSFITLLFCSINWIFTRQVDTIQFLVSILSFVALLFLYTNLYKYEIYTNLITKSIQVKTQFFSNWLIISVVFFVISLGISMTLPKTYPLLPVDSIGKGIKYAYYALVGSDRQRLATSQSNTNLQSSSQARTNITVSQTEVSQFRNELKNMAYILLALFILFVILAIIGGIIRKKYGYKRIPKSLHILVLFWELFLKMIKVNNFIYRIFRSIFSKLFSRKKEEKKDEIRRKELRRFFTTSQKFSPEKKEEILNIINIYLSFIKAGEKRGINFGRGFTPNEYMAKVVSQVGEIEEPARALTDVFYLSRYSDEVLGTMRIVEARKLLEECLMVFSRVDLRKKNQSDNK